MAAGGPQKRTSESAAREAAWVARNVSDDQRTRLDEITGILCSTDGRLPLSAVARLRTLTMGGAHP
jgi:hypothetical protein